MLKIEWHDVTLSISRPKLSQWNLTLKKKKLLSKRFFLIIKKKGNVQQIL